MSERLPGINDDERNEEMASFVKQGLEIRERLQAIENTLMEAGYDDFVVATDRGTFHWTVTPQPATE